MSLSSTARVTFYFFFLQKMSFAFSATGQDILHTRLPNVDTLEYSTKHSSHADLVYSQFDLLETIEMITANKYQKVNLLFLQ